METIYTSPSPVIVKNEKPFSDYTAISSTTVNGIERLWVAVRVRFRILLIALRCYHSLPKALATARVLAKFKKTVYGKKQLRRCIKINGKYYFGIYIPAFPSSIFNRYIQTELNHILPHRQSVDRLQVVQLAITNKCPLRCEHCFEWNNLNREEPFTTEQFKQLVKKYQEAGCSQFHFTGGEPLVKMKELVDLIKSSGPSSEYWILTSGINLTPLNARKLKEAGVTGIVVSLDHFDPVVHNFFRGSDHAYEKAIRAVLNAREAGMVTAFSICTTRSFVSRPNLLRYAQLAKDCGVAFVQLLEPKAVGHYEHKPVMLSKEHTDILDDFYLMINFGKEYRDYPVFIYHGFYQRKIGCLSGGNRVLYIDSAGYIHACPFCQTKSYHAGDIISGKLNVRDLQIGGCPTYKTNDQYKDVMTIK